MFAPLDPGGHRPEHGKGYQSRVKGWFTMNGTGRPDEVSRHHAFAACPDITKRNGPRLPGGRSVAPLRRHDPTAIMIEGVLATEQLLTFLI